jgi:hypothetical protein
LFREILPLPSWTALGHQAASQDFHVGILGFAFRCGLGAKLRGICASEYCYRLLRHVSSWTSLSPSTLIDPEWEFSYRSFAVGLGPIPFVLIPEVSPAYVSPLQ